MLLRWAAPGRYVAAFTTRLGGTSEGRYASLNLGILTADDPLRVEGNRRRACQQLDVDPQALAMNRQVHGAVVNEALRGARGAVGDGLWTDRVRLPLLALSADCLPIVLVRVARARPAVAVLHAGRAGLLAGIVQAGVAAVGGPVAAVVGPCIGVCCYEVGPEVAEPYGARFGGEVLRGSCLDLRLAASRLLEQAGCERVEHVDHCTSCEARLFFSHRRDGAMTGRQGVIAYVA